MKNFRQYVSFKENDGMAPPQNQMNPSANQLPPTGPSPSEQNPDQIPDKPSPEASAEMEGITNDIQRQLNKLFQVISRHNLNKRKTVLLLTTMIQQIAGDKLTGSNAAQMGRNAVTSNGPGINSPMQPMANG